jgi:hypothetical protein
LQAHYQGFVQHFPGVFRTQCAFPREAPVQQVVAAEAGGDAEITGRNRMTAQQIRHLTMAPK